MKPLYKLKNWSVSFRTVSATSIRLHGEVDEWVDGKWALVTTSVVIAAEGRIVETMNSRYELCEPCPRYVELREAIGRPIDPVCPVQVLVKP